VKPLQSARLADAGTRKGVIDEAYRDPDVVRSAPHNQVVAKLSDRDINDPANWATSWAACQRKQG